MTLEILDPARRLGDRDVPAAERTAVYASNHPEVGWGTTLSRMLQMRKLRPREWKSPAQRATAKKQQRQGVSRLSRRPTNGWLSGQCQGDC